MSPHDQQGSDVLMHLMAEVTRPTDAHVEIAQQKARDDAAIMGGTAAIVRRRRAQNATTVIIVKGQS